MVGQRPGVVVGQMNRGQWGGVLQFYAWGVVAIAVVGLVGPLRERLPRTAALLLATGVLAGVFGASYGIDSIWATVTGQPQLVDQEVTAGLVAMGPGALVLPITLIGLGVAYTRTGLVAAPVSSLLALAGVLFPLGRAANLLPVAMATAWCCSSPWSRSAGLCCLAGPPGFPVRRRRSARATQPSNVRRPGSALSAPGASVTSPSTAGGDGGGEVAAVHVGA